MTDKGLFLYLNLFGFVLFHLQDQYQSDAWHCLLRKDFDNLISDIQKIKISKNYLGLFSWMIDRAFKILPGSLRNQKSISSVLNKNKPLLLKTLYEVNSYANLLLNMLDKHHCPLSPHKGALAYC